MADSIAQMNDSGCCSTAEPPLARETHPDTRLQSLLAHAMRIFLTSTPDTLNTDMGLVLKHLGKHLQAPTVAWLLCPQLNFSGCHALVSPTQPRLHQQLQQHSDVWQGLIVGSRVRLLNGHHPAEKRLLALLGAEAAILVPVVGKHSESGCLLIAAGASQHVPDPAQLPLLSALAQLCYLAVDRLSLLRQLQSRERLLARTEQRAAIGSWHSYGDQAYVQVSAQTARLLGLAKDTQTLHVRQFLQCLHPEDSVRVRRSKVLAVRRGQGSDIIYRIIDLHGRQRTLHAVTEVITDAQGKVVGHWGSVQDVTEQQLTERNLLQAATLFESTNEGVVITDASGRVEAVNPAFERITGYLGKDVVQQPISMLKSTRHDDSFYQSLLSQLRQQGRWHGEVWNRRSNGEIYPQWLTVTAVQDAEGQIGNYVGVFNDISSQRRSEQQLEQLSYYDSLTNLPNRNLLMQRLQAAITDAAQNHDKLAVIAIDLDHFKHINDSLGHPAGDRLLQQFAKRLQQRLRDSDTLARQSGDDFIVIIEQVQSQQQVAMMADGIKRLLRLPFDLGIGQELMIGASMGITLYPDHGDNATQLLSNADVAMYRAKQRGRNHYQFYSDEMTRAASDRLELGSQLRQALQWGGQLQLYYQPQVCMHSNRVVGLEALMRWCHPQDGIIPPGRFLPVAEDNGLMPELDTCALTQACQQIAQWQQQGLKPLTVAVNITQPTFVAGGLVETLSLLLQRYRIDAGWLELEITEGALLEPTPAVLNTIAGLKALGVSLAVDDFGTGYSSLAYLHRYKVDKLKIDRSFVLGLDEDDGQVITTTIINMARGLGLQVLAEGVECEQQLAFLRDNLCQTYQGFLFSRPLPLAQLQPLLQQAV